MPRQKRQFMRQGVADLPDRAAVKSYVGAPAEPIFDGDRLRMHDGATVGGIPLARCGRKAVANANYAAVPGDAYVGMTQLTATLTVSLPAAASFEPGQALYIADESGACSENLPIIISATGSDTIAGQPSVLLATPYQKLTFHSNGSNLWTFA